MLDTLERGVKGGKWSRDQEDSHRAVNCSRYTAVGRYVDSQTQMDLLRWAAQQRQVHSRMVDEECERTPADRFPAVLSMLQASTLFPGYEQAWQADEAAVRENWVRLKRMMRARAR